MDELEKLKQEKAQLQHKIDYIEEGRRKSWAKEIVQKKDIQPERIITVPPGTLFHEIENVIFHLNLPEDFWVLFGKHLFPVRKFREGSLQMEMQGIYITLEDVRKYRNPSPREKLNKIKEVIDAPDALEQIKLIL